ncbi:hypothetical protein HNQ51_000167 [Inhella inkyongensis]|uniref:Uncharacterized protein n=1 Tax=Inhella inkyongensis TaxID=392593 RepID=A0A840S1Y9_9BURK|nr:hypothetical protein [Inhella inkyongensis]MBB5202874.1 hypothetical protein [Inhella inkyongensis]
MPQSVEAAVEQVLRVLGAVLPQEGAEMARDYLRHGEALLAVEMALGNMMDNDCALESSAAGQVLDLMSGLFEMRLLAQIKSDLNYLTSLSSRPEA